MRCFGDGDPLYERYHDTEWGVPERGEHELFERLCLEAFQSGLAWITILRKREAFRAAFAGFDPELVAAFGAADVERLMADAGIVRNRAKIDATIANARAVLGLRAAGRTLSELVWSHAPAVPVREPRPATFAEVPASTPESAALATGAQGGRLPVRRADHRLRRDAGVRPGGRPPGRVPGQSPIHAQLSEAGSSSTRAVLSVFGPQAAATGIESVADEDSST